MISIKIAHNGLRAIEMFVDRLDSDEFERFVDNGIYNNFSWILNKFSFFI